MYLLLIAHRDLRMSAQKVMQCRRAGFLRTGQNEIELLNLFRLPPPHRLESRTDNRFAQLMSQKTRDRIEIVDLFCNAKAGSLS